MQNSRMVSETAIPAGEGCNEANRPSSSKKNQGKVRKKIHKANREKQKRDHMNVLFLQLSKAVEPANESNGKASILKDTIRLLKELLTQVDYLKKENVGLLSESHYVTVEKNELIEENSALEAQVGKLQNGFREQTHTQSSMNLNTFSPQNNTIAPQPQEEHYRLPTIDNASQSATVVGPIFILPLHHDSQVCHQSVTAEAFPSNLSKPLPRYPSASNSWPSHILDGQLNDSENTRQSTGSISSGTSSGM